MSTKLKKYLAIILAAFMSASMSACGSSGGSTGQSSSAETLNSETAAPDGMSNADRMKSEETASGSAVSETDTTSNTGGKTLVVYFSATGTTKGIAEKIASVTGGDLFEIVPAELYTDEDLDYSSDKSRTSIEQNDKSIRPEILDDVKNWDAYSVVFLGHPIWWGQEPRILDTFVESYSFEGKTVIPFCTSGGSSIGQSQDNLKAEAGSGTWLDGKRFSGSTSKEDIKSWIDGMNLY